MRRAFTFGTLLAATLTLTTGGAGAATADLQQRGEVCIQQSGAFLADLRIGFNEYGGIRWSYEDKQAVPVGQSFCVPFGANDELAFISIAVVLGHRKECEFSLKNRSGRLTAILTGTTLNVGLTCP